MTKTVIRRLSDQDKSEWQKLWHEYNKFYERTVEDRTTERVWLALQSNSGQPYGYAAELNGQLVGFTHYFFLHSTSDWAPRCYMQDLFADPAVRGRGIGHQLIQSVYAHADNEQAAQTYWLTATSNKLAQKLYDRVAKITPFVKYRR